jgi:hypothetical protein
MENNFDDALDKILKPPKKPLQLEPIRKRQGGIECLSELTAEGVVQACGFMLSGAFNPRVTISHESITFNPACTKYFSNCQYFSVRVDDTSLRLVVEPTIEDDPKGYKVAYLRNGKTVARKCTAKQLCAFLFDLMDWKQDTRYRIEPDFRGFEGFGKKSFLIFNLDEGVEVPS